MGRRGARGVDGSPRGRESHVSGPSRSVETPLRRSEENGAQFWTLCHVVARVFVHSRSTEYSRMINQHFKLDTKFIVFGSCHELPARSANLKLLFVIDHCGDAD